MVGLFSGELRTSGLLLAGVALALVARAPRGWYWGLLRAPRVAPAPAVLVVGSGALQVLTRRFLDMDLVSAALLLVALYGLAGFHLPGHLWRRAASVVALAVAVLPFGYHLEVYAGFPARLLATKSASGVLGALGVANSSTESLLVMENGLASVDLPCAGMKSLWVGALLTLALAAVQGRRVGWRLAAVLAGQGAAMLTANAVRVTVLALLAVAAGQAELASLLHVPLGLFGFLLAAGAAAWATVRFVPIVRAAPGGDAGPRQASLLPPLLVTSALVALAAVSTRRPLPLPPREAPQAVLPDAFSAVPQALTDAEADLFGRHHAAGARKFAFSWAGRRGSLLLVPATSWRAHHPAATCLVAAGLTLQGTSTLAPGDGFAAQQLVLGPVPAGAVTWFQQGDRTVATLAERIAEAPFGSEAPWVMATVMLEGAPDAALMDAAREVRAAVQRAWEGVR
jgi:exosortase O